jgi:hypothetical protein
MTLATLCTAVGVLAFAGAPAQATTRHNFVGSFGPGGPGSGAFGGYAHGVAVDQSTGDVYVYDTSAEFKLSVYKFNAAGEPQNFSALGTNVIEGSGESYPAEAQIAVDSSGGDIYVTEGEQVTVYGEDGSLLGELNSGVEADGGHWGFPCGVAVDPAGNVYVGIGFGGEGYVDKYSPSGSPVSANSDFVSSLVGFGDEEESCNLAADSAGDVYVAPYLHAGSPAGVTEYSASQFHAPGEEAPAFGTLIDSDPAGASLAVDPSSGDLYIDEQSDVAEYDPATTPARRVSSFGSLSESSGVAVDHESDEVYVAAAGEGGEVDIYGPALVLPEVRVVAPVSFSSGLHGTSVTLNGTVNPEGTSVTACVFEYGTTTGYGQSAPCIPAASPSTAVSAEVAGLQSDTKYYFRLAATNANGTEEAAETFETPGPMIDAESVANLLSSSVELQAQIDPLGTDTSYYFQYGTTGCAASPSTCTDVPAPPGVDIGNGTTDQGVAQQARDLAPGTYHYRVVAVQGAEAFPGVEHTFTTLSTAVAGLPDGRQWEMVSPANKTGSQPGAITREGGLIQASANGDAIAYTANGPFAAEKQPEGARNPEETQILSSRGAAGWASQDLATVNSTGRGITVGVNQEYQFFSSDLALALLQPFPGGSERFSALAEPPLSPPLSESEKGKQEKTIYLRDDAPLAPEATEAGSYEAAVRDGQLMQNPGFLALVTEVNAPGGEPFGSALVNGENGGLEFQGATPDLGHAVFYSHRAAPGLYEWGAGGTVLQPVSVLPGQTSVAKESDLGGPADRDARHAISDDGRLVFWTHKSGGVEGHLYVRDMQTGESLQIDALRGGSGAGEVDAVFQTASADGSKVFFTDTQRLTADSKAEGSKPDLYVAELSGGAGGALAGTLTDLTPEGISGESAAVVAESNGGGVLGASEDGSYVYFVAQGMLASGAPATSGKCNAPVSGTTCDLYVRHYDEATRAWEPARFIATLSSGDQPDWDGHNLKNMTSRVSSDGEYLAFMSDRSLTGYDNLDVNEATVFGEPGPHADEEVYLYDANSERLVCASCDPSGARPAGVYDPGVILQGELLVDWPAIWGPVDIPSTPATEAGHWLAGSVPGWTPLEPTKALYQSRYLSNSGRLFFNSPDELVPTVTSVMERVYEYEPNNVGSCEGPSGCVGLISPASAEHESAFLDASENGNDVFFLTSERLVPQDIDSLRDVYDAHVCEAASPCLSASTVASSPCEETPALPCKGPGSFTPAFTAPASTGASGSGNLPPPLSKPVVKAKAKPLTRAQKLKKALKACKRDKKPAKRAKCKRRARKRYGPKRKAKKHKAGKSSGEGRRG